MIGAILVHIFVVGLGPPTIVVALLMLAGMWVYRRWNRVIG